MHTHFHVGGRNCDLDLPVIIDAEVEVKSSTARRRHDDIRHRGDDLVNESADIGADRRVEELPDQRQQIGERLRIANAGNDAVDRLCGIRAEQTSEVDDHIIYRRNIHVLAVHVEDAPLSGRTDVAAGDGRVAVLVLGIGGDDDRTLAVLDAIHRLFEDCLGLIGVPSEHRLIRGIGVEDGKHFVLCVKLEEVGAFRLHHFAVHDVRLLVLGVGVALVEEEPDDDGDGHPAGRRIKDHAVVVGEVAVILEAGVVVLVQFRDPGVAHALFGKLLKGGEDLFRDRVAHRLSGKISEAGEDLRLIDLPPAVAVGDTDGIGGIGQEIVVVDEVEQLFVERIGEEPFVITLAVLKIGV